MISIIVPVYNEEQYLHRCINSLLDQSYQDFELILVDDGSLDHSGDICEEYAQKDNRIRVIHQENRGLSGARNTGLDVAQGDYIGFVDSDDYIHKDMFSRLYEGLKSCDADIAMCDYFVVYKDGRTEEFRHNFNNKIMTNLETLHILGTIPWTVIWNKLFKRKLFDETRFPIGKINEDIFIMHKLFYDSKRIVSIEGGLYYYFLSNNSLTRDYEGKRRNDISRLDLFEAIAERIKFYEDHSISSLLDNFMSTVIRKFCDYRDVVKITNKEDKNRLNSIKLFFRKRLWKYRNFIGKEYLLYFIFPRIYHLLKSIKKH